MRPLASLCCAIALACCGSVAFAKNELANVKTVAVISAIGDCFHLQTVNNIAGPFQSPQCAAIDGIDETVTAQISKALSPRYAVKTVKYDRKAFARMPFLMASITGEADIDDALKTLQNPGVDAYVVVQKLRLPNVISDNNTRSEGIGIAHERGTFGNTYKLFALFTIRVIDARTLKELADHPVKKPGSFLGLFPIVDADQSLWARNAAEMTETQKASAKAQMMTLIQEAVADSLRKMELAP